MWAIIIFLVIFNIINVFRIEFILNRCIKIFFIASTSFIFFKYFRSYSLLERTYIRWWNRKTLIIIIFIRFIWCKNRTSIIFSGWLDFLMITICSSCDLDWWFGNNLLCFLILSCRLYFFIILLSFGFFINTIIDLFPIIFQSNFFLLQSFFLLLAKFWIIRLLAWLSFIIFCFTSCWTFITNIKFSSCNLTS